MPKYGFEFDPEFDENVKKASSKSRSSLRPLFDKVREVTDKIYYEAFDSIKAEAGRAEAEVQAAKVNRFKKGQKGAFDFARAKAFALKTAQNTIAPTMEYDGEEIHGRVAIYRKNSSSLEYGGVDSAVEVGKGTGEFLEHPAYAFLRRAMDRAG